MLLDGAENRSEALDQDDKVKRPVVGDRCEVLAFLIQDRVKSSQEACLDALLANWSTDRELMPILAATAYVDCRINCFRWR